MENSVPGTRRLVPTDIGILSSMHHLANINKCVSDLNS